MMHLKDFVSMINLAIIGNVKRTSLFIKLKKVKPTSEFYLK